ncbi:MAG: cation:proton antiporter, partial [Desulfuromonadales bacterium]|nr:cation:proton antiporter [Desulfuromonadales bacterium]
WHWIVALTLFTMVARSLSTGLALMAVGTPPHEARRAGLALMPLGEFTFVIAGLGVGAQVLPPEFYSIAVGVSILTVLLTPVINRHAEPFLGRMERAEPRWVHRTLEIYHHWLAQLGNAHAGRLWWQLSRKRLLQVALEMLFITGLLIFSERLLGAFQQSSLAGGWRPETARLLFWAAIGILVLFPFVAIWRNLAATAMIFAELAATRTRLPAPLVENSLKALSALGLGYWLAYILPSESLPGWGWIVIAAVLVSVLVIFSRRLIYWHSGWQSTLQDVFAEERLSEPSPPMPWLEKTDDWDLRIQEFLVPDRAACSGHSIADLRVRSQFGCTIVEIDRHGHAIIAPEPTEAIYAGDRLLLLGTPEQIAAARSGLSQVKGVDEIADFDQARLERVTVPVGPRTGGSISELQIQRQTGVLVVGIDRAGKRVVNPAGDELLNEGDELLILGPPEQVRRFRRWLVEV